AVISLFGIGLTVQILRGREALERAQKLSLSRELAANAENVLEVDPQLSLLLIQRAASIEPTVQVREALAAYSRGAGRAALRHSGPVWSAVFSPDGLRVLTASDDNTARAWDASSGKLLTELRGHSSPVLSAVFSPDGLRVLTASKDNTARIWDASSGKLLAELRGHSSFVRRAVFSPDGLRVLTASGDNTARVWDASSGK